MLVPALVLSGGASSRMGSPKALLRLGDRCFLSRVVGTLLEANVPEVIVVTGAHHDAIAGEVDRWPAEWPVRLLRNDAPATDQISSVRAGLTLIDRPGVAGVLIALVDHPLVTPATVVRLREAFASGHSPIVRPRLGGRHGHPVIFGREAFDALREPSPDGAKTVLRRFADRQRSVEVDDEGVLIDVDTPEDYERVRTRFT